MKKIGISHTVLRGKQSLTLEDLANNREHTYWKFSQSQKGRSIEKRYAEYIPNKITIAEDKDKWLSFVNEANIAKCYMYGDTLTKFVFDVLNQDFKTIKKSQVKYIGGLGEYECKYLLAEECYSLEKTETIRKIFELCNSQRDFICIFNGIPNNRSLDNSRKNMGYYLCEYGFKETAELFEKLSKSYSPFLDFAKSKAYMLKLIDETK